MVHKRYSDKGFFVTCPRRLQVEIPTVIFLILSIQIDWGRLVAKRPIAPNTIDNKLRYLLQPKILSLLDAKKHSVYSLISSLKGTAGTRVLEGLTSKPTSFVDDSYDYGVILKTLKLRPGRPTKKALQCSPKRYISISDHTLADRIQNYFITGISRKPSEFFNVPADGEPVIRVRVGGTTEIYTKVLTVDGVHFLGMGGFSF